MSDVDSDSEWFNIVEEREYETMDGKQTDDAETDDAETDDGETVDAEIIEAETNDAETDGAETDDAKTDDAETDDAETDDAKTEDTVLVEASGDVCGCLDADEGEEAINHDEELSMVDDLDGVMGVNFDTDSNVAKDFVLVVNTDVGISEGAKLEGILSVKAVVSFLSEVAEETNGEANAEAAEEIGKVSEEVGRTDLQCAVRDCFKDESEFDAVKEDFVELITGTEGEVTLSAGTSNLQCAV